MPVLGEVFSSLVPLRYKRSESVSYVDYIRIPSLHTMWKNLQNAPLTINQGL